MISIKPKLLIVGSFTTEAHKEQGGINGQCRLLVTTLDSHINLLLLDSTPPYLPPPPLAMRFSAAVGRFCRLAYIIHSGRPDAAFIYSSGGASFLEKSAMVLLLRLFNVPVVLSIVAGVFMSQVERSRLFSRVASVLLKGPNRILCQGHSWVQFFAQTLRVDPGKLFVIPNWIALDRIDHGPRPARTGPFRVLFVGHVKRSKGVFELIEALASPALSEVTADIVGDGEATEEVRARIASSGFGLAQRINLHGWRKSAELRSYFDRSDVLILPSYAEGFPNVVLEAMASGLPVIVTPVGSVPDVIVDGVNGRIIPVRDSQAIAIAIAALANDPAASRRMGENNRQIALTHGVERAANKLLEELVIICPTFAQTLEERIAPG